MKAQKNISEKKAFAPLLHVTHLQKIVIDRKTPDIDVVYSRQQSENLLVAIKFKLIQEKHKHSRAGSTRTSFSAPRLIKSFATKNFRINRSAIQQRGISFVSNSE